MELVIKMYFKKVNFEGNNIIKNRLNEKKLDAWDETYPYNPPGPALLKWIIGFNNISCEGLSCFT